MKETYIIIKNYLLNGLYAYALFGFYALTISPFITRFIAYGDKNIFIAVLGFTMLIAEFFALNFKLKMIRIRAEEKRIAYKKETGINIIPRPSVFVLFGFFMRLAFRVTIIMICMTALGYPSHEQAMCSQGVAAVMIGLFIDLIGLTYIYLSSGFYTDPPENKRELQEELKDEEDWDKTNLPMASSIKYFRLELISDLILQIYAFMLFTSFWKFINQKGIEIIHSSIQNSDSAFAAGTNVFSMLFFMVILGLMPMRIAYWIEDSMLAFTRRERLGMWIMFFIVAIFTCIPAIIKFIELFILHYRDIQDQPQPEYFGYLISIVLFIILLLVQIILFGKKDPPSK